MTKTKVERDWAHGPPQLRSELGFEHWPPSSRVHSELCWPPWTNGAGLRSGLWTPSSPCGRSWPGLWLSSGVQACASEPFPSSFLLQVKFLLSPLLKATLSSSQTEQRRNRHDPRSVLSPLNHAPTSILTPHNPVFNFRVSFSWHEALAYLSLSPPHHIFSTTSHHLPHWRLLQTSCAWVNLATAPLATCCWNWWSFLSRPSGRLSLLNRPWALISLRVSHLQTCVVLGSISPSVVAWAKV